MYLQTSPGIYFLLFSHLCQKVNLLSETGSILTLCVTPKKKNVPLFPNFLHPLVPSAACKYTYAINVCYKYTFTLLSLVTVGTLTFLYHKALSRTDTHIS